VAEAEFLELLPNLCSGVEKNHEKLQSGQSLSQPRFEPYILLKYYEITLLRMPLCVQRYGGTRFSILIRTLQLSSFEPITLGPRQARRLYPGSRVLASKQLRMQRNERRMIIA
jgi:hypothetical protein